MPLSASRPNGPHAAQHPLLHAIYGHFGAARYSADGGRTGDMEIPLTDGSTARVAWHRAANALIFEVRVAPLPECAAEELLKVLMRLNAAPSDHGGIRFALGPGGVLSLLCLLPDAGTDLSTCIETLNRLAAERQRWAFILNLAESTTATMSTRG